MSAVKRSSRTVTPRHLEAAERRLSLRGQGPPKPRTTSATPTIATSRHRAARRPHPAAEPAAQLELDQELELDRLYHRSRTPAREKLLQAPSLTGLE
jgi:hypothetical protein